MFKLKFRAPPAPPMKEAPSESNSQSKTISHRTLPKVLPLPLRLLHHKDLPSQRIRKRRDLCKHPEEGLEPDQLVARQHPWSGQMSVNCAFPRKCPQLAGRQNVHGKLRRVLQTRQNDHQSIRDAQRTQNPRKQCTAKSISRIIQRRQVSKNRSLKCISRRLWRSRTRTRRNGWNVYDLHSHLSLFIIKLTHSSKHQKPTKHISMLRKA